MSSNEQKLAKCSCRKHIHVRVKSELKKEGRSIQWLTETLFTNWLKDKGIFLN